MSSKQHQRGRRSMSRSGEWNPGNVIGIDPHKQALLSSWG